MYTSYIKPILDFLIAALVLVVFSPIIIMIMAGLVFYNRGTPFFMQPRPGKNEKVFNLIKFKTMRDTFDKNGILLPDKDRITPVGAWIRKLSLDELPQLINVLKGDMSLVGPRPSLPKEVEQFDNWMFKRLSVRPGLTCYWQVSGRNNIDFEDWMKLDVKYVEERNLWIDIKLIFKTVFVLFGDKNAH